MGNLLRSTTETAMHIVAEYIREVKCPVIIDATCGRGNDTVALAKAATGEFVLFAFDIQAEAIESTSKLLRENGFDTSMKNLHIIRDSHLNVDKYTESIDAAVFNLGYLPGGDKSVTTCGSISVSAVMKAVDMLNPNGIVAVTMYDGHKEGRAEKEMILEKLECLDSRIYHVAYLKLVNQHRNPPETVFVTRKV